MDSKILDDITNSIKTKLGDENVLSGDCTYYNTDSDYYTQKIDIPEELEKVCEHFEEVSVPIQVLLN